jgi:hypothetical protein
VKSAKSVVEFFRLRLAALWSSCRTVLDDVAAFGWDDWLMLNR